MEVAISVAKCHFQVECEIHHRILSSNQEPNACYQEPKWKKIINGSNCSWSPAMATIMEI
jgi:hypothetical protein